MIYSNFKEKISNMKRLYLIWILIIMANVSFAQIYEPEGVNMPGSWDGWTQPPNNMTLRSVNDTVDGVAGMVGKITGLASPHYQTIFTTLSSGDTNAINSGSYEFLFTSGPKSNLYANKWTDVAVSLNTIQTYYWHNDGGGNNNSISLNPDRWYVVNFEDNGYQDTRAIFMEFSSRPALVDTILQIPDTNVVQSSDEVAVKIILDTVAAQEQSFVIRYTTDNWATSQLVVCSVNNDTATGIIPSLAAGTNVSYYVFSTNTTALNNLSNPSPADYDLITIDFLNNSGLNFSYQVADQQVQPSDTPAAIYKVGAVYTIPAMPLEDSSVVVYFDATLGNGALAGYTGDVYAHTGVITTKSSTPTEWLHVVSDWGENLAKTKFTRIAPDLYKLEISNIRDYYGITDSSEHVLQLAMVIRSADPVSPDRPDDYIVAREEDGGDFFMPVYPANDLAVRITSPNKLSFLYGPGDVINFSAFALNSDELDLLVDGTVLMTSTVDSAVKEIWADSLPQGNHYLVARATKGTQVVYDTVKFLVMGAPEIAELPAGVHNGINYESDTSVVLVLWDPPARKNYVFVLGDFNNWQPDERYYMKRTPDGTHFWLRIGGLQKGKEYAYQYLIDGDLKIADPYCHKILDPWNDQYIQNYPDLMPYPSGKTTGIVSVLQTGQSQYQWQVENFVPRSLNENQPNLTVYELLVRDFVESSAIKDVTAKLDYLKDLGIDAIEIMPITEFEGNISWGYNPDFYFATDKYYGTEQDYKQFIDECHKRGIAVILDVVFNHAFGQCPLVQMYWDSKNGVPSADNPWFNQTCPHPLGVGYDFNHESLATREFVKDVLRYWLEEFKIDGFRFDLSKGFTQTYSTDLASWSAYDQSRIDILKDYYDFVKSINPNAYVVLEHFADNSEEQVLANYGFLLWQNMNYNFGQALMGWQDGSDFSWSYYQNRGFTYPNNLTFMESHDEERLMYKALQYGNSTASYDVKDLNTSLQRSKGLATFFYTIPGPKMMWQFQELGYDYSLNYCTDGTISEECRTSPKPVRWDYFYEDTARLGLYNVYRKLINFRHSNDIVRNGTYTYNLSGMVKEQWLSSDTLNLYVVANFDVVSYTVDLNFQHTGTWYDILAGQTIDVASTPLSKTLQPGEYHLFADKQLSMVDDVSASVETTGHDIMLYPNPAHDKIYLSEPVQGSISIYTITGKLVKKQQARQEISIKDLQPGLYIYMLETGGRVTTGKIIKE